MNASLSRIALGFEALIIALPVSLLFPVMVGLDLIMSPWAFVVLPAGACLVAGWRLIISFLYRGESALTASPKHDWILLHVGALLATVGMAALLIPWERIVTLPPEGGELPGPLPELRGLAFAAPLLVPYAHLLLARYFAADSNNRWRGP